MKVSAAALSIFILAVTLGSPAHGSLAHESLEAESRIVIQQLKPIIHSQGFQRPPDCCQTYTSRKIRCELMESYFQTTLGCSRPGVIFVTKRGQRVCTNPDNAEVQECIMNLRATLGGNLNRSYLTH